MNGNRFRISILCCAALGTFGSSVLAQDTSRFKLYAGPAYVAPMSDSDVTLGAITDAVEAQEKVGWNLGGELRFGKWMGLEVDYVNATQDVSFGGETIGEADFSPLTATLNFHLLHTKVVDFYFGPSYSYINWGEIHLNANGGDLTGSSDIGTDSAQCWGASLGLDFGIGEHFAITGGLRYLNADLEVQDGPSVAVNPLVARLGVAFRF